MSGLQKLVNSLVAVINGYFQIKKNPNLTIDELISIAPLLAKTPEELMTSLKEMIEAVKKDSSARANFLEYLAYLIKTINVCTNKKEPLTAEEKTHVKEILSTLILSIQNLRVLSPRNTYLIKYDGKEFYSPGFAGYASYTQCLTGALLQKLLPIPGLALTTTEFTVKDIERFISGLIEEHQEFCDLESKCARVIQQNEVLKKQIDNLAQQLLDAESKQAESLSEVRPNYSPGFYQRHFGSQPDFTSQLLEMSRKASPGPLKRNTPHNSDPQLEISWTIGAPDFSVD